MRGVLILFVLDFIAQTLTLVALFFHLNYKVRVVSTCPDRHMNKRIVSCLMLAIKGSGMTACSQNKPF